jgi:hemoglobin
LNDIATEDDVKRLVDTFYDDVARDSLLGPICNDVARVDWAHHLPTMYAFWHTMLFRSATYKGRPWPKHAVLPVRQEHFQRWLSLFCKAVDSLFAGPKASEAKSVALSIADTFQTRFGIFNPYLYQYKTPDPARSEQAPAAQRA